VTALARVPAKLDVQHARLRVVQGEASDAESIDRAMSGQQAVLCAFGPRTLKPGDLQELLMRNLLAAMQRHGVKRLVNLSGRGVSATVSTLPWFYHLLIKPIMKHLIADKERGEALLFASPVDYVNVRPGGLTNARARGAVRANEDGIGFGTTISRADVAAFMVEQLNSDAWVRRSPVIGY
jgi:uncharacterized protein YbjT (DUF2867 family)